jgi:DNA-binding transcriptional ArsR family regulator
MSVVVMLAGASADRFTVTVSPLAELAAALHALTEPAHHAEHADWAREVAGAAPADVRAGLRRFSPLWNALRWRAFYPGVDPATLPVDRFAELTGYVCASGYTGFDFSRVLHEPAQSAVLLRTAAMLPEPHLRLAQDLLGDPEALRADVLAFLARSRQVFFDDLWRRTYPLLAEAADLLRRDLADRGPAAALLALSPGSEQPATGPPRVVFDKVHHAVITPARTPVLLIPTRYGAPHLLVKNEPGLPPVVHFPITGPEVTATLARKRVLAITNDRRIPLCRLIARQPMTTADLADRLNMNPPQVSRHLRHLRELGLLLDERSGRYTLHALDLTLVERLGHDLAIALQY